MNFKNAYVKSVKGDFAKGEIQITITVPFDKENSVIAAELARYADADAGSVELFVTPRQMSFKASSSELSLDDD